VTQQQAAVVARTRQGPGGEEGQGGERAGGERRGEVRRRGGRKEEVR